MKEGGTSVKNESNPSGARHNGIARGGLALAAIGGVLIAVVLAGWMSGGGSRTNSSADSARDSRVASAVTEAPTALTPATPSVPPPARLSATPPAYPSATPKTHRSATPQATEVLAQPAIQVPATAAGAIVSPATGTPAVAAKVSFASRDGSMVFTVPAPGDPEYADYQEMLQDPHFRSTLEGLPGYALPYDPEWRSVVRGKRTTARAPVHFDGGAGSLDDLARAYLQAIGAGDELAVLRLRISRDEFEHILWPEFPQSRPYVRILPADAWTMHHASTMSGVVKALEEQSGRELDLVGVEYGDVVEYTNFTLYRDVSIRVRDASTQRVLELPYVPVVARCNGKFKAYLYRG
jgi:hypothetical protein